MIHTTPDITLILPAYKFEAHAARNLRMAVRILASKPYSSEILCVDDGSSDKTYQRLVDEAGQFPNVRVLRNDRNMGKGFAIRRAVAEAKGAHIFFTDIDLAFPLHQIDTFREFLLSGHDVVIANRRSPSSRFLMSPRDFSRIHIRHTISGILNRINRHLFFHHNDIHDSQAGFKGFTAGCAKKIFEKVTIPGFGFDIELLVIAVENNCRIVSLPVTVLHDESDSSVEIIRLSCRIAIDFVRIAMKRKRGKYAFTSTA